MSPATAATIVVGLLVAGALIVAWLLRRDDGRPTRGEFEQIKRERTEALRALILIRAKADEFSDIDSVLAASIRKILTDFESTRLENQ